MHDITVVIPVYRAEHSLQELAHRLVATLEAIAGRFEVVFVEDCGGDRSWDIIAAPSRADPRIRGIKIKPKYGQHKTLLCGMRPARHPTIPNLDPQLQYTPP